MEVLYKHIEKLLGIHEYVIVPGLGGFVLQQHSASITENQIIAPRLIVSFNALMQHSDGLLVIEIARTNRISYRLAQELLQTKINDVKQQLFASGNFQFGSIGVFYADGEKNISFVPNTYASFIPANFGLIDYLLPDYGKQQIPITQNSLSIPIFRNTLRYAAVIALTFASLMFTEHNSRNADRQTAGIVNLIRFNNTARLQEEADTIAIKEATVAEGAVQTGTIGTTKTINYQNESELFHVIVASMPTLQMAENYCKMVKALNYQDAIVLEPSKTYKVAIKSFADKKEAIRFMEKLRVSDEHFETAWVLCKK